MLQANEVRLGNWIEYTDPITGKSKYGQIKAGDIGCISPHRDEYKPIPITPAILVKAGFAPLIDNEYYWSIQLPNGTGDLNVNPATGIVWVHKSDSSINPNSCHSLHQLMNLFYALSGEELNLEL